MAGHHTCSPCRPSLIERRGGVLEEVDEVRIEHLPRLRCARRGIFRRAGLIEAGRVWIRGSVRLAGDLHVEVGVDERRWRGARPLPEAGPFDVAPAGGDRADVRSPVPTGIDDEALAGD